jgi:UDP-2,4-diacetamido-2,4,6-trideoxy-beta-L-altropyranose hydrolase
MQIVFRTDASLQIGAGHVMRCLSLADEMQKRGADCLFICSPLEGNLVSFISQRGHKVIVFPDYLIGASKNLINTAHAHWLGTNSTVDAECTKEIINTYMGSVPVDWLIVDHYALECNWEIGMRKYVRHIMVIDDLADRLHECDILLDQNLGRIKQDYFELLPLGTKLLIGPQFSLLRPEFATARSLSLYRRNKYWRLENILITMGGFDKNNVTEQVLNALCECSFSSNLSIIVIMGKNAPWVERVQSVAKKMKNPTNVLVGVGNMAEVMSNSDLVIGAVGSTVWESCCLGLPSIVFELAANQRTSSVGLNKVRAAILLEQPHQIIQLLEKWHDEQLTSQMLKQLSQAAAAVTDGQGCIRVADHLFEYVNA